MSTTIQTTLVSIRRAAAMMGLNENYTRTIIANSPEIKVRKIGGCNAVSYPQVRRIFAQKGVKFGRPYETRKYKLGVELRKLSPGAR